VDLAWLAEILLAIVFVLDDEIGAPLSLASARVRKHVGPPCITSGFLWVRPGAALHCITSLQHRGHQRCDLGPSHVEQDKIWRQRHAVALRPVRSAPARAAQPYSFSEQFPAFIVASREPSL
jgi:hypothetical protein